MTKFEITTIINQPPDIVWKAFVDQENMTRWMRYLEKVEVVKGKLESEGIPVHLKYESLGPVLGVIANGLGQVKVMVPAKLADDAKEIINPDAL